jgi:hypothetical protein
LTSGKKKHTIDKGKPSVRMGRKASGPQEGVVADSGVAKGRRIDKALSKKKGFFYTPAPPANRTVRAREGERSDENPLLSSRKLCYYYQPAYVLCCLYL